MRFTGDKHLWSSSHGLGTCLRLDFILPSSFSVPSTTFLTFTDLVRFCNASIVSCATIVSEGDAYLSIFCD